MKSFLERSRYELNRNETKRNIGGCKLILLNSCVKDIQYIYTSDRERVEHVAMRENRIQDIALHFICNCAASSTESSKTALQTMTSMTGALVPDAALVTTLHYYPPAPALVQISQAEPATNCRSQVGAFFSGVQTGVYKHLGAKPKPYMRARIITLTGRRNIYADTRCKSSSPDD